MFDGNTRRQRAVSDLVAFTLTFAVVVSGVGFVYIAGFDSLAGLRDSEKAMSADRTMQGVAQTYEEVHEEDVPGRSLEIELGGSSLRTVDSRLSVRINDSASTPIFDRTLTPNALVLDSKGRETKFVYEVGGLFRLGRQGQLLRHRPTARCTDDRALLSLIELIGNVSVGGDTSVVLVGQRVEGGSAKLFPGPSASGGGYYQPTEAANVTIDVSGTAAADAWTQYFDRSEWEQSTRPGEYYCDVGSDGTVFLRKTTIELSTIF